MARTFFFGDICFGTLRAMVLAVHGIWVKTPTGGHKEETGQAAAGRSAIEGELCWKWNRNNQRTSELWCMLGRWIPTEHGRDYS